MPTGLRLRTRGAFVAMACGDEKPGGADSQITPSRARGTAARRDQRRPWIGFASESGEVPMPALADIGTGSRISLFVAADRLSARFRPDVAWSEIAPFHGREY